jgi:ferrous iron transport protein B
MSSHGKENAGLQKKIALVGNPNVGKSVLFGALTGRYATVSNYPGTTVEVSRGRFRLKGEEWSLIDSPGVNTLVPTSEDERVARDILLKEDFESVIQVIDSKNLRRGLLVTLQLVEMGLPVTMALNMYDEAGDKGIHIDSEGLAKALGLPAVPTIATQRWGIERLKEKAFSITQGITERKALKTVQYPEIIEDGIRTIEELLTEGHGPGERISKRALALMLLAGDETLSGWLAKKLDKTAIKKIADVRSGLQSRFSDSLGFVINRERLKAVDAIIKKVVMEEPIQAGRIAAFIGKWSMHPVGGLAILGLVLYLMYEFVGVFGAGTSVDFLEGYIFGEYLNPWATRVVEVVFATGFIYDLLVGPYGIITMALTYAIAIVLPIVGYFFIFFGFLEDSGYLPRLSIMVDRIFKLMGLNGKAVLPMVLGLGCDTMATMTTRILETRKERIIVTLLLALGIPCSAQLGVILGMLGSVSFYATIWWAGAVVLTIFFVAFLASLVIPGETSDFILEIPPIRMPKLSNIVLKTLMRVEWYFKEAVPFFILGTLVLFTLDKTGLLKVFETVASPVIVNFLNLPIEATEAFIVGFLRRDYGAAGLLVLERKGLLDPVQVVVSLVTITLFIPCIANFFIIIKERGWKTAIWMSAFIFPFAVIIGGLLNAILRGLNVTL